MSDSTRHRRDLSAQYKTQDQALQELVEKGERELVEKREARAKAREMRMQKLKEDQEEGSDSDGRQSRPDTPLMSTRTPTRIEVPSLQLDSPSPSLQEQLNDLEKRFKEVNIANASLSNEKEKLMYQRDLLKDEVVDLESVNQGLREEIKLKARLVSQQALALERLQSEMEGLRQLIAYRDEFIESKGLVLPDPFANEDVCEVGENGLDSRNNQATSAYVQDLEEEVSRLKKDKQSLQDQLKHLKQENSSLRVAVDAMPDNIERINGQDYKDQIREHTKQIHDYKSKWQLAEGEKSRLEAKVQRHEHTVKRLKQQVEDMEKQEDELKTKNRKLNRELIKAQTESTQLVEDKEHLQKRIETLKRRKLNET